MPPGEESPGGCGPCRRATPRRKACVAGRLVRAEKARRLTWQRGQGACPGGTAAPCAACAIPVCAGGDGGFGGTAFSAPAQGVSGRGPTCVAVRFPSGNVRFSGVFFPGAAPERRHVRTKKAEGSRVTALPAKKRGEKAGHGEEAGRGKSGGGKKSAGVFHEKHLLGGVCPGFSDTGPGAFTPAGRYAGRAGARPQGGC